MIPLQNDLDAFFNLGYDSVNIAGEFGFRDADRCDHFDHSVSFSRGRPHWFGRWT
jgi:hypothetical protein